MFQPRRSSRAGRSGAVPDPAEQGAEQDEANYRWFAPDPVPEVDEPPGTGPDGPGRGDAEQPGRGPAWYDTEDGTDPGPGGHPRPRGYVVAVPVTRRPRDHGSRGGGDSRGGDGRGGDGRAGAGGRESLFAPESYERAGYGPPDRGAGDPEADFRAAYPDAPYGAPVEEYPAAGYPPAEARGGGYQDSGYRLPAGPDGGYETAGQFDRPDMPDMPDTRDRRGDPRADRLAEDRSAPGGYVEADRYGEADGYAGGGGYEGTRAYGGTDGGSGNGDYGTEAAGYGEAGGYVAADGYAGAGDYRSGEYARSREYTGSVDGSRPGDAGGYEGAGGYVGDRAGRGDYRAPAGYDPADSYQDGNGYQTANGYDRAPGYDRSGGADRADGYESRGYDDGAARFDRAESRHRADLPEDFRAADQAEDFRAADQYDATAVNADAEYPDSGYPADPGFAGGPAYGRAEYGGADYPDPDADPAPYLDASRADAEVPGPPAAPSGPASADGVANAPSLPPLPVQKIDFFRRDSPPTFDAGPPPTVQAPLEEEHASGHTARTDEFDLLDYEILGGGPSGRRRADPVVDSRGDADGAAGDARDAPERAEEHAVAGPPAPGLVGDLTGPGLPGAVDLPDDTLDSGAFDAGTSDPRTSDPRTSGAAIGGIEMPDAADIVPALPGVRGPDGSAAATHAQDASADRAGRAAEDSAAAAADRLVLERLAESVDELVRLRRHDAELVDRLHAENSRLRGGELTEAMAPLLRGLVRLYDQMSSLGGEDSQSVAGILRKQLLQILDLAADVRPFTPEVGESFDPGRFLGVRRVATDDPALAGTVARTVRPGFVRGESTVIRPAETEVYRAR